MSHHKPKDQKPKGASVANEPKTAPASTPVAVAKAPSAHDHGHAGHGHAAAHVHGPGCAHGAHEHPPYMKVFYALVVLTAAEVGIAYPGLGVPHPVMVGTLVAMSLAKAALVGMYFMHLALDNRKLMVVVLSPFVLSAMLFLIPVLETHSSQPSPPRPDKAKPAK